MSLRTFRNLDEQWGWIGKYVNAVLALLVIIGVSMMSKLYVTRDEYTNTVSDLLIFKGYMEDHSKNQIRESYRLQSLEEFRSDQRSANANADKLFTSINVQLSQLNKELSNQTLLQTQNARRLERIEDLFDSRRGYNNQ